jgi:hypothetical protein
MAGGQVPRKSQLRKALKQAVTPQFRIGEFEEVKALADRFAFGEAIGVENPYFRVNDGVTRAHSIINGAEVTNSSSYNYLACRPSRGVRGSVGFGAPMGQLVLGVAPDLR